MTNKFSDFIIFESQQLITLGPELDYNDKVALKRNNNEILKCVANLGGLVNLECNMREYKVCRDGVLKVDLNSPWKISSKREWALTHKDLKGVHAYNLKAAHFHVGGNLHITEGNIVEKLEIVRLISIDY